MLSRNLYIIFRLSRFNNMLLFLKSLGIDIIVSVGTFRLRKCNKHIIIKVLNKSIMNYILCMMDVANLQSSFKLTSNFFCLNMMKKKEG